MKYLGILVLLLALTASVMAQKRFTASFTLQGAARNFGYMTGSVTYDWDQKTIIYQFTPNSYKEHHSFNDNRGSTSVAQQYIYQTATAPVCNGGCQITSLGARMPPMGFQPTSADGYTASGSANGCTRYVPSSVTGNSNQATEILLNPTTFAPCGITYANGRVFTFTNVQLGAGPGSFTVPSSCTCQKRIDLVLLLDGSGSISSSEWQGVMNYCRGVVNNFDFGAEAAAMAIVQFASSSRVEKTWTSSKSSLQTYLQSTIPQMRGGTNVVHGLTLIRNNLWPSRRTGSIPILITVTDGVDQSSATTITNEINNHKNLGIQHFFSIFVGTASQNPTSQMNALAGGVAARVHRYNDFNALSNGVKDIVAAACDADVGSSTSSCGVSCCGFCMCSTCATPTGCNDGLHCTTEALQSTGLGFSCCSVPANKVCTPSNLCKLSSCDPNTGSCVETDRVCTSNDPCKVPTCDPNNGCQLKDKCVASNPCMIASCNNGVCSESPKPCPANEPCRTWSCSNGQCVATPVVCNDNDPCTADSCVDGTGCVHRYDCHACPLPSDVCTTRTCVNGVTLNTSNCVTSPDPCRSYTGACTLASGCASVPVCDDNDPCTNNVCNGGSCSFPPKCTGSNKCKIPSCSATGVCSETDKTCPPNTPCATFTCNPSTGNCDVTLKNCEKGDPCLRDTCDPSITVGDPCVRTPQDCNCTCSIPADICNTRGCHQGSCVNISRCTTSPDPCYTYSGKCDFTTGCEKIPVCNDNDPCTVDLCDGSSGTAVCDFTQDTCVSDDPCRIPSCDAANGTCTLTDVACPADDACTTHRCVGGVCQNTTNTCDDGNDCTADFCDPVTGCYHTPQECNCTCLEADTLCFKWVCSKGNCSQVSKCLTSDDPCFVYTGSCDEATGCETRYSCDDNNTCTDESCVNGTCISAPKVCDDGDPCTDDFCEGGVCRHPATTCFLDHCHTAVCTPGVGCEYTPFDNSTCDDFNACTVDSCDPAVGCQHQNVSETCADADACTDDYCNPIFGCQSSLKICPDKPKCSIGICNNGTCDFFTPELCQEDIILASTLGVGAIIGIVIAVVVVLALAGGAAYKARQMYNAKADLDAYGQENPLFEKAGTEGTSGIYQAKGGSDYKSM